MRQGATLALVTLGLIGIAPAPAPAASWSLPDRSMGARITPLLLLSRADIRDDLQLGPELAGDVDRAIADLYKQANALKGQTGDVAVDRRRAVDEGQRLWLEAHLTEVQRDRLAQLEIRWEGPAAMASRPSVAEALGLSDEQRATLARAVAGRNARRGKGDDLAAADRELTREAMAVLSDGQKLRWERMLGHPFAFRPTAPPHPPAR